ncbi:metallo-beta-lactamase superfamily:flavin reductase-like domain [Prochlorococcus marinus str. NATL2A]|uniref:Metallo-beta-lactamase superfamily:flavin reductase-like domain n=1 Tax=Prochlorococcus marinus (strain NATL2A) TaxID=59920 RepID=Q46I14_PROMT|nr:diflavin flavoprotein [Prochlorococcus marinus]AAZ58864.1 metallo-beta-lactamase superfamily:flavin reductase-like domain [Prochlorococcus marinus str. NATL2A]
MIFTKSTALENQKSDIPKLSLQYEQIAIDTHTLRSLDWDRSRFDIEFGLRNGTTYNSFLIRGKKTALIDTSHLKFKDIWFEKLRQEINPTEIDYLIVSHTEPDHSGLIKYLIELNPNIEIVASKVAIKFLKDQIHQPFKSRAVKSGEEINLESTSISGIEHRIEFISAPNLHWPDTIFSFDHGTQVLYTCDAFGLHYCSEKLYDENPSLLNEDFRFYYDCLMGPNARSVVQALKKIDSLPTIQTIGVGHGPILNFNTQLWLNHYREWSTQRSTGENYAVVCYLSQYGYCDRLSQAIAHGIGKANAQVQLVDLIASDTQELSALISEASAVVVPTWPIKTDSELQSNIGTLLASLKQKQWVATYDSYGGNEEPIDFITNQLRKLGQKEAFKPLRVRDEPNKSVYQQFEEAGTDLGQILTRKKNIAATKSLDGDLNKALGCLSGGLYVVTAKDNEGADSRDGAMVASWVSQASFDPPGITVAVAKDRAIESLLQVNDRFVLNILQENNYLHLFRHFLKRFPPGANRFEGVELMNDLAAGGPVLSDALAFLSCKVIQRMETTDHWIIYSSVEKGNLSNTQSKTAVHHRRLGSNY